MNSLDSSSDMRNHDITPLMCLSAKESRRVAPSLEGKEGGVAVGVLRVISCSRKPHLKPAFCFLNMDLIPSLMIYDKRDQCRLRVKAVCVCLCVGLRECVCVWA